MKLFINGRDRVAVKRVKGSDESLNCLVTGDDGSLENLTGDTVDLLVYNNSARAGAPTVLSGVLVNAAAGHFTVAIADTDLSALLVGEIWYAFARVTEASAIKISDNAIAMEVL